MAHFAQIENGVVLRVVVIDNADILDDDGHEVEAKGIALCQELTGGGEWVQCSYTGSQRGCYPGIGYIWDGQVFTVPAPPAQLLTDEQTEA
jgi:hypothetical protein